ncbi:helix-turn-helix domain-containing protein [Sporosarcina thermotolerans]|uniref:Helix-turn-helix domain-containing protein n=1 Tax=Sporosarcina thermotolerans TaxID=633404 RepID=A0AAW9AA87_9BACL|nr:helix-turn-helix domain-containing protein [Sporosarcina thermotolerans]MDW0116593.1 helix-turn-helix domain-containing protein [Sporosarcina thermotolerans]WHT48805.1 helix-turn-helix domain-containing protein [Sporosarcina thermotolerans]
MAIGTIIKTERLRKNMKQETLAKEICSISHLSRIESGKTEPSEELLRKLSDRLGVLLAVESENVEMEQLQDQLETVINERDQEGAAQLVEELNVLLHRVPIEAEIRLDLELMLLRAQSVLPKQEENILQSLAKFTETDFNLTPIQAFRAQQIKGMASYGVGELKVCLDCFSEGAELAELLPLSRFERADFAYVQSIAFMADGQKFEALEKAKDALSYFQSIMTGRRVLECHLVSGVAYKQIGQLDRALETFQHAEKVCRQFDLQTFLGMIYQNLGTVYNAMNQSDLAISYFRQAIDCKEQPEDQVYTILSLLRIYEELGGGEKVRHWLEEGNRLLSQLSEPIRQRFKTHFDVHQALLEENDERIEASLLTAVRYFQKKKDKNQTRHYSRRLAEFYASKRKYKKAVDYYRQIVELED